MLQRKWVVTNEGRLLAAWTDLSTVTPGPVKPERRASGRSRRTRRSVPGGAASLS
jgi:hypothetical protein